MDGTDTVKPLEADGGRVVGEVEEEEVDAELDEAATDSCSSLTAAAAASDDGTTCCCCCCCC